MARFRFPFLPGLAAAAVSVCAAAGFGQVATDKPPAGAARTPDELVAKPAAKTNLEAEARLRKEIEKFQAEQRERLLRPLPAAPAPAAVLAARVPNMDVRLANVVMMTQSNGVRVIFVMAPKPDPAEGPGQDLEVVDDNKPALGNRDDLVISEQSIESLLFGHDNNATMARTQLDNLLARLIKSLDEVCQLTPEQKRKLELAGKGDIQRYFERVAEMRTTLQQVRIDKGDIRGMAARVSAAIKPTQELRASMWGNGPFGEASLFAKARRNALTENQAAEYDRRTANHK